MKRLLASGTLALCIHGFLLGINFQWPGKISLDMPSPRSLKMTLTSIPIRATPKPTLPKPKPALKNPAIVKKKISKPKGILKASPPKKAQIPPQSNKIEIPKNKIENTSEMTEPQFDSEQAVSKTLLNGSKQTAASKPSLKIVREARPIYRSNPSPKYPRIARIREYQGVVLLNVLVNSEGEVNDVKIFKSSGYPILDRAATSSVKRWLFEPGMIGEEKVDMWVRIPVRFELK